MLQKSEYDSTLSGNSYSAAHIKFTLDCTSHYREFPLVDAWVLARHGNSPSNSREEDLRGGKVNADAITTALAETIRVVNYIMQLTMENLRFSERQT